MEPKCQATVATCSNYKGIRRNPNLSMISLHVSPLRPFCLNLQALLMLSQHTVRVHSSSIATGRLWWYWKLENGTMGMF